MTQSPRPLTERALLSSSFPQYQLAPAKPGLPLWHRACIIPEVNAVTEMALQDLLFLAVDRKVRGGALCGEMGGSLLTQVTAAECCLTVEC